MLLVCTFLIEPECFQSLAHGASQYTNLTAATWGNSGKTIDYLYDANGSVVKKTTKSDGTTISEELEYVYNLQGRLSAIIDTNGTSDPGDDTTQVEYEYNPQGVRAKKID